MSLKKIFTRLVMAISFFAIVACSDSDSSSSNSRDIVDTAVAAGQFTTLARALEVADLIDTLKSEGPFTVFAPTDAAFANLPAGTLDSLLADPAALRNILLYHVVSGEALAGSLSNGQQIRTVQGQTVRVSINGGNIRINNSNVTQADIRASNGVIHVIDAVLIP